MKSTENTASFVKDKIHSKKFVSFSIGKEKYGIDVSRAKEVLYLIEIVEVPNSLPYLMGVIDLRGIIVPLIDARIKFGLESQSYTDDTVIIIIEYGERLVGLIVDAVLDVLDISVNEIQDPTHFHENIEKDYVSGISKINDDLIIVLDVDRIFVESELELITRENSNESLAV
jgi:purine-binding chemotaxis protein CheW